MRSNMTSQQTGRFYVYTLAEPDGRIFYVGKGSGPRVNAHASEARKGECCCLKCVTIRNVWDRGGDIVIDFPFRTNSQREACRYERDLINEIGVENLCNRQGSPSKAWTEGLVQTLRQKYRSEQIAKSERALENLRRADAARKQKKSQPVVLIGRLPSKGRKV